jgi:hypothetical protein
MKTRDPKMILTFTQIFKKKDTNPESSAGLQGP